MSEKMKSSPVFVAFTVIVIAKASFRSQGLASTGALRIPDDFSQCGGLLEGEQGEFRHSLPAAPSVPAKVDDNVNDYNDSELCLWFLYVPGTEEIALSLEELDGTDPALILRPGLTGMNVKPLPAVYDFSSTSLDSSAVGTTTVKSGDLMTLVILRNETRTVAFRWDSNHVKGSHARISTISALRHVPYAMEIIPKGSLKGNSTLKTATTTTTTTTPEPEEETPTHIFFGNRDGLRAFDLTTSKVSVVTRTPTHGVAYDSVSKKIFPYKTNGEIIRANLDGSGAETIASINMTKYGLDGGIESFSIDRSTGNLYALTAFESIILVCNITSTPVTCAKIVRIEGAWSLGTLALHPSTGTMYFGTSYPGRIYRAGMDGFGLEIIYNYNDTQVSGQITVDPEGSTLFWADQMGRRILRSSDMKGSSWSTVVQLAPEAWPKGVVVLKGRLYWTDTMGPTLHSSDLAGRDIRTHYRGTSSVWELTLVNTQEHKQLGRGSWHNIEVPACSHIRVLKAGGKSFRCFCPPDMELAADNQTCIDTPQSLLKCTFTNIMNRTTARLLYVALGSLPWKKATK